MCAVVAITMIPSSDYVCEICVGNVGLYRPLGNLQHDQKLGIAHTMAQSC
jgi:hypothetical protein